MVRHFVAVLSLAVFLVFPLASTSYSGELGTLGEYIRGEPTLSAEPAVKVDQCKKLLESISSNSDILVKSYRKILKAQGFGLSELMEEEYRFKIAQEYASSVAGILKENKCL